MHDDVLLNLLNKRFLDYLISKKYIYVDPSAESAAKCNSKHAVATTSVFGLKSKGKRWQDRSIGPTWEEQTAGQKPEAVSWQWNVTKRDKSGFETFLSLPFPNEDRDILLFS